MKTQTSPHLIVVPPFILLLNETCRLFLNKLAKDTVLTNSFKIAVTILFKLETMSVK